MDTLTNIKYATDILIFSIDSRENSNCRELPNKYFSILLVKRNKEPFKDMWCLPGGYIKEDETSFQAAQRVLEKETNLTNTYLEQLYVFDDINRDPRQRTISTTYMALIDKNKIKDNLSEDSKWIDIDIKETNKEINITLLKEDEINITINKELINKPSNQYQYHLINSKNIAFDHGLIINKGIIELRNKAENTDIIFNLMPNKFTIGELKQVYEIILNKKLISSAFRRVISKKVIEIDEEIKTGGHRPSKKYKYKGK